MKYTEKFNSTERQILVDTLKDNFKFTLIVLGIILIIMSFIFLFLSIINNFPISLIDSIVFIITTSLLCWTLFILIFVIRTITIFIDLFIGNKIVIKGKPESVYFVRPYGSISGYKMDLEGYDFTLDFNEKAHIDNNGSFEIHFTPISVTIFYKRMI